VPLKRRAEVSLILQKVQKSRVLTFGGDFGENIVSRSRHCCGPRFEAQLWTCCDGMCGGANFRYERSKSPDEPSGRSRYFVNLSVLVCGGQVGESQDLRSCQPAGSNEKAAEDARTTDSLETRLRRQLQGVTRTVSITMRFFRANARLGLLSSTLRSSNSSWMCSSCRQAAQTRYGSSATSVPAAEAKPWYTTSPIFYVNACE
jgi:hypothetical protein